MSRKIVALILVVIGLLAIFIPLGVLESRHTPDWQSELSRYLEVSGMAEQDIQHVEVAKAQQPAQFPEQLLKARPTGWTWQGIAEIPLPDDVRCVRIEKSHSQTGREYLLVGYHNDGLWRVGWLVHEFRDTVSETDQQAWLAKLGCNNWAEVSASILYEP